MGVSSHWTEKWTARKLEHRVKWWLCCSS